LMVAFAYIITHPLNSSVLSICVHPKNSIGLSNKVCPVTCIEELNISESASKFSVEESVALAFALSVIL
jgi:hypothetical protein